MRRASEAQPSSWRGGGWHVWVVQAQAGGEFGELLLLLCPHGRCRGHFIQEVGVRGVAVGADAFEKLPPQVAVGAVPPDFDRGIRDRFFKSQAWLHPGGEPPGRAAADIIGIGMTQPLDEQGDTCRSFVLLRAETGIDGVVGESFSAFCFRSASSICITDSVHAVTLSFTGSSRTCCSSYSLRRPAEVRGGAVLGTGLAARLMFCRGVAAGGARSWSSRPAMVSLWLRMTGVKMPPVSKAAAAAPVMTAFSDFRDTSVRAPGGPR